MREEERAALSGCSGCTPSRRRSFGETLHSPRWSGKGCLSHIILQSILVPDYAPEHCLIILHIIHCEELIHLHMS